MLPPLQGIRTVLTSNSLTLKAGEVKGRPLMVLALDQAPWGAARGATGAVALVMPNRSVGAMSMPTMMNT